MLKLLIFFGFLFGIFYFFYYKIKKFLTDILYPQPKKESKSTHRESINKGEMVKCPVCDTYFPENTGIKKNGRIYCSADCMEKDNQ